ncbi:FtsX-like permease family protein [Paenibacillus pinihumi]|uniref:FtsX-like permease family protein n=1 Tax=Paenibacillus pinihumi TaxID=669462 RepID=UPI000400C27B|nr:ABC transporter permease [Paenibacillus pinihumi]
MTFRKLAINNVIGNKDKYISFFLSSVFSVMVFFVYASVIFHPGIHAGQIMGGQAVALAMVACEIIILIFSFFFVLYSCSAFLKSRKKEFGLFTLFGFTKGQLRKMVMYENMLIGLFSTASGIGLGLLFNKLFFMLVSDLIGLAQPISFYWPAEAIMLTIAGYFTLFLLITLISMHQAGKLEIRELLIASRQPKRLPKFSVWLVLLSLVTIGYGYWLAYTLDMRQMLVLILPITGLVVLGTYFLFTQSSIVILKLLQSSKKFYYNRTNMIIISQMMFKLKDNALVLFLVSVLCAVVLTSSGFLNVLLNGTKTQMLERYPQTIGIHEVGLESHRVIDPDVVRQMLKDNGEEIRYETKVIGIPIKATVPAMMRTVDTVVIAQSDYNALASRMDKIEPVDIAYGHACFLYPIYGMNRQFVHPGEQISYTLEGQSMLFKMNGQLEGFVVQTSTIFIVNDKQYAEMAVQVPDGSKHVFYGFELKNWEKATESIEKIAQQVPDAHKTDFVSRSKEYAGFRQISSLFFFIAVFVSILFFVASGSLLFFKLFTELEEDRQQLQALRRIGLTRSEMSRIVTAQIATLFYLPCLVGGIHAAFAMKATSNVIFAEVWLYSGIIYLVYLVMQTVYFLAARNAYFKKIVI